MENNNKIRVKEDFVTDLAFQHCLAFLRKEAENK